MELLVSIEPRPDTPLYRVLAEAIKESIHNGRVQLGQPMPSVRELADSLSLSCSTVFRCYEDLASQGYIETIGRAGTYVSKRLPGDLTNFPMPPVVAEDPPEELQWSKYGASLLQNERIVAQLDCFSEELNYGMPISHDLPLSQLSKYFKKYAQLTAPCLHTYDADPLGHTPLRQALCAYLTRARSVQSSFDRVVVGQSSQIIIDTVCRLLLNPGDLVAVEDPCYPHPRRTFISHGAQICPMPVDEHGLVTSALDSLPPELKIIYVTPSHQDPKGPVLPLQRRFELLKWARERNVLILEDDYDSEYRYGSKPIPCLQGLDQNDCVVYFSSFWRTLGPIVKMGYGVIPNRLVMNFRRAKSIIERDYPLIDQIALAEFINDGHLERHIRKTRALYCRRRQALVYALTMNLGAKMLRISRETAGMHLLVHFDHEIEESIIENAALAAKIPIKSTGGYYTGEPAQGEYLIAFAHAPEAAIRVCVERFAESLKLSLGSRFSDWHRPGISRPA